MTDSGVICRGPWQGREVLGIRLNWHKRYITLGPVATVIGLAFKLYDPDHLIGERDEIGITRRAGADQPAGRRDRPPAPAGDDGVPERPDHRPRRLHPDRQRHRRRDPGRQGLEDADERARRRARHLAAVAVGGGRRLRRPRHRRLCAHPRAVPRADRPLPGDPGAARPHGRHRLSPRRRAPAHLRRHRSRPQARGDHRHHEGAGDRTAARRGQRRHGRARRQGRAGRPAQLSRHALSLRSHRHHGRGRQHRHAQPDPVRAGRDPQPSLSAAGDDRARGSRPRPRPRRVRPRVLGPRRAQLRQCVARLEPRLDRRPVRAGAGGGRRRGATTSALGRYASAFALAVDVALLTLGGGLKRREMVSARFGDILSELYLLSAVLKRWQDEGRQRADLPLVQWCMACGFATIEARLRSDPREFPQPPGGVAAALPRAAVRPHASAVPPIA